MTLYLQHNLHKNAVWWAYKCSTMHVGLLWWEFYQLRTLQQLSKMYKGIKTPAGISSLCISNMIMVCPRGYESFWSLWLVFLKLLSQCDVQSSIRTASEQALFGSNHTTVWRHFNSHYHNTDKIQNLAQKDTSVKFLGPRSKVKVTVLFLSVF